MLRDLKRENGIRFHAVPAAKVGEHNEQEVEGRTFECCLRFRRRGGPDRMGIACGMREIDERHVLRRPRFPGHGPCESGGVHEHDKREDRPGVRAGRLPPEEEVHGHREERRDERARGPSGDGLHPRSGRWRRDHIRGRHRGPGNPGTPGHRAVRRGGVCPAGGTRHGRRVS